MSCGFKEIIIFELCLYKGTYNFKAGQSSFRIPHCQRPLFKLKHNTLLKLFESKKNLIYIFNKFILSLVFDQNATPIVIWKTRKGAWWWWNPKVLRPAFNTLRYSKIHSLTFNLFLFILCSYLFFFWVPLVIVTFW